MAAPYHTIALFRFQHDFSLPTFHELDNKLVHIAKLPGWDYTCFGDVHGQPRVLLLVIGWRYDSGKESAAQIQSSDFWDDLQSHLITEVNVTNVAIRFSWSTLITPYLTELVFLRGPPEIVEPDDLAKRIETLCQRTIPSPDHEPPEALVGCDLGVTYGSDQNAEVTAVSLWRWTNKESREAFVDPKQESLGGPTQYADLVEGLLEEATAAGTHLERFDVDFDRWRPEKGNQQEDDIWFLP